MNYRTDYWDKHYKTATRQEPSEFAKFCLPFMYGSVLDVCCGDGRDFYLFDKKLEVIYFDFIPSMGLYSDLRDKFDFPKADNVYCRFVLHAIPEDLEDHVLIQSNKVLDKGGLLFIETRSDKGTEDKSHYRRLINLDTLTKKLSNLNFEIIHSEESDGLSVHHDNPVLIRIIAKKKGEIKVRSDISFNEFHEGVTALDKEACKHLLFSTKKVLKDITFMLVFGTLLGAYRDGDFIEWDEDVDIALFDRDKEAVDKLIKGGYFAIYGLEFIRDDPVCYSFVYDNNYIDLYFFTDTGEDFVCGSKMKIERTQLDKLSTIKFLGEDFQTVRYITRYLIDKYGMKWIEPIKDKHATT
jgi:ubiquinone/menaquinone biosynthesis C-methylase UbiE